MDLRVAWSLAETGYSFAAVAAFGIAWSVGRWAPQGRETTLLWSSILGLAAFYGCYAVDAARHSTAGAGSPFTVWSAFGQVALVASGTLFVTFLLGVVTRLSTPSRPSSWLVWAIVAPVALADVLAVVLAGRLLSTLLGDLPPEIVDDYVHGAVSRSGTLAITLCFIGPMAFLGALVADVPRGAQARWIKWLTDGGAWQVAPGDLVARESPVPSRALHRFRRVALLFVSVAWLLNSHWMQGLQITLLSIGMTALLRVSLLPSLLALVYYHARFVFFDVLVTRGLVAVLIALGVTVSVFLVVGVMRLPIDGSWVATACVVITLLILASARAVNDAQGWVSRLVFRRPDYRLAFPALASAMAACRTADELTVVVTTQLRNTLGATFVRCNAEPEAEADVTIGLGRQDHPRGYLQLGRRARGQPYGSDDLTFVDAVAGHMTAVLEAFEARESARVATEAELRALRAQINPHFLFNALTSLAERAREQPSTEHAIANLSRVFRYALIATRHELVPLGEEVDAMRAYLAIEADRFDDLRVDVAVPDELRSARVPPMLLQPLVENALTHGVSSNRGGTIRIGAAREDGHLRLTVQDDGVGFDLDRTPRGIGLSNVGARVERAGGWWRVQSIPGVGTEVTLAVVTS